MPIPTPSADAHVLAPYIIDPNTSSASAAVPADVVTLIYAAAQEGIPATFLQWHQGMSGRGAMIVLLNSVSRYVPRMGMTASLWDNLFFTLKEDVTCDDITFVNCHTISLHQIGSTVHFLTYLAIDAALANDPDANLMGTFTATNTDVEPFRVHKIIHLTASFIGLFLKQDLTPAKVLICLHRAIVDGEKRWIFRRSLIGFVSR